MSYKHLSLEERHYIEISLKNEKTLSEIGKNLGRSQGTITREIARNKGQRGYHHNQANGMANKRHKTKPKAHKLTAEIVDVIENYIRKDWSPEQVVGWLEREGIIKLHHETLYQLHSIMEKSLPTMKRLQRRYNARRILPSHIIRGNVDRMKMPMVC